jgi:hypothetical protein
MAVSGISAVPPEPQDRQALQQKSRRGVDLLLLLLLLLLPAVEVSWEVWRLDADTCLGIACSSCFDAYLARLWGLLAELWTDDPAFTQTSIGALCCRS